MWGYPEDCGGVQYCGGYHEYRGGYLEYHKEILNTVRDIMGTVGCSVPWGENLLLFEYPTVLNIPMVLMISPHIYHDIPHSTQISKDGIPMVLNTPMVLMIFPCPS